MNKRFRMADMTSVFAKQWPGVIVWVLGWLLMPLVFETFTLGTMAMLLLLTSTVASLWLRPLVTVALCLLNVLAFDWFIVPPRFSFALELSQYLWLLVVMFSVGVLVAMLMSVLRDHASQVEHQALLIGVLQKWGDTLRDAADVVDCLPALRLMLSGFAGADVVAMALRSALPSTDDKDAVALAGDAGDADVATLWRGLRDHADAGREGPLCLRFRGKSMVFGAALVRQKQVTDEMRAQLQALCDMMGAALERQHVQRRQQESDQKAWEQTSRATLLTAISHDLRTPLATIMGAASALDQQGSLLTPTQRRSWIRRIYEESVRLRQLTNNILELVRLDSPGQQLQCDWQSADELVDAAATRCREPERLQLELDAGLPLLWCDPLLVSQLLDNLIDNACKYSTKGTPIRLKVSAGDDTVSFTVSDEGPGIPVELREMVFQPFQQGQALALGGRNGVGLGLALCRLVAMMHKGSLALKSLPSGSSFEFRLPQRKQPALPPEATGMQREN